IWRLIGQSLLVGLIAIGLVVVFYGILFGSLGLASVSGDGGFIIPLLAIPLGFVGLLVTIAWLMVKLLLAPCSIMLERAGVMASLRRSWRLTRGNYWRILGITVLTLILVQVLVTVVSLPVTMIAGILARAGSMLPMAIATSAGQFISMALSLPITSAIIALLYVDVRMRKEGLDVALARAA